VTRLTNSRMDLLAAPSFHDGSGSAARAMVEMKANAHKSAAAKRSCLPVVFIAFLFLKKKGRTPKDGCGPIG
jgi:hypothetical protein